MSLVRELGRPASPLRGFFDERLPQMNEPRATHKAALAGASTTLPAAIPGGSPFPTTVPSDVLGHAISARFLWDLEPPPPDLGDAVLLRVPTIAGQPADALSHRFGQPSDTVEAFGAAIDAGPLAAGPDVAARVSWIGGLLDRIVRAFPSPDDPWFQPLFEATSWDGLLASVPDWAVADVVTVHDRCAGHLAALGAVPVVVAPTFAGSGAVGGADADFIADTTLIDIKAIKDPALKARDLRQIVAYALLDWTDTYGINAVGVLAARQGALVTWPLGDLVTAMAGEPVDVAELRFALRDHLAATDPWSGDDDV